MIKFSNFKKIGDLDYFQGPLLSLFVDEQEGNLYLCSWLKKLDISYLWLVFQVNSNDILAYMQKDVDHLKLSKRSMDKKYYLIEIGANAVVLNTKEISEETFLKSPNLMAKAGLFFDEDSCEDEEEIRAFLQKTKPKILFEPISFHHKAQTPIKKANLFDPKTTNLYATQSAY